MSRKSADFKKSGQLVDTLHHSGSPCNVRIPHLWTVIPTLRLSCVTWLNFIYIPKSMWIVLSYLYFYNVHLIPKRMCMTSLFYFKILGQMIYLFATKLTKHRNKFECQHATSNTIHNNLSFDRFSKVKSIAAFKNFPQNIQQKNNSHKSSSRRPKANSPSDLDHPLHWSWPFTSKQKYAK